MVVITCIAFAPGPIRMIRSTVLELIESAPDGNIQAAVADAVAAVRTGFDLSPPEVRVTKLGPRLYVEVEGTVDPSVTVAQEHEVRNALRRRLSDLPYDVWMNVELLPRGEIHDHHDGHRDGPDPDETVR
ncbi:MAG: hypothetical protein GX643_11020 [Acidimicrobiales bacterium]|nr:hypothetical protein [Acidimicrobiales bacterium]